MSVIYVCVYSGPRYGDLVRIRVTNNIIGPEEKSEFLELLQQPEESLKAFKIRNLDGVYISDLIEKDFMDYGVEKEDMYLYKSNVYDKLGLYFKKKGIPYELVTPANTK